MPDTESSPTDKNSENLLSESDIEDVCHNAITHVASTSYKKTLARLDSSPEYHDKSGEEKKSVAYQLVKNSLNESYGENLRTNLIKINTLKDEIISEVSDIIVTEEESSENGEDLEDET